MARPSTLDLMLLTPIGVLKASPHVNQSMANIASINQHLMYKYILIISTMERISVEFTLVMKRNRQHQEKRGGMTMSQANLFGIVDSSRSLFLCPKPTKKVRIKRILEMSQVKVWRNYSLLPFPQDVTRQAIFQIS